MPKSKQSPKRLKWGDPLRVACETFASKISRQDAFSVFCLMVTLPRGIPDSIPAPQNGNLSRWRLFKRVPRENEDYDYVMSKARSVFDVYDLEQTEKFFWETFFQKIFLKEKRERSFIREDNISLFETGSFFDDSEDDSEDDLEDDLESKEVESKEISELDDKISALSEKIDLQNQKISFIDEHFVKMQKAFMVLFGGSLKDDEARRPEGDIAP